MHNSVAMVGCYSQAMRELMLVKQFEKIEAHMIHFVI